MDLEKGIAVAEGLVGGAGKVVKEIPNMFPQTTDVLDDMMKEKIHPTSKLEKLEKGVEHVKNAAPELSKTVGKNASEVIDRLGSELNDRLNEYLSKTHGSKVKVGKYSECPIVDAGTISAIIDIGNNNEIIYLSTEFVKTCRYAKKKFKKLKRKNDYYYEIIFHDGSQSYIRVSEKHKKNMDDLVKMTKDLE